MDYQVNIQQQPPNSISTSFNSLLHNFITMFNPIRATVSRKKRRYRQNGFDLDLTYITKNIIAMGFPSDSIEGLFRNPMSEVVKLLDMNHFKKYKVYNLCLEKSYNPEKFYGRVANYPFKDHNAPPYEMIKPFCEDVSDWLQRDPENVAVIHCKAGKGRTGMMICAYLLYAKHASTASDANLFYGNARTTNGKGVTIPSQIRYIQYWQMSLSSQLPYTRPVVQMQAVHIHFPPFKTCLVSILVHTSTSVPIVLCTDVRLVHLPNTDFVRLELNDAYLRGDFCLQFTLKDPTSKLRKLRFQCWLNTCFLKSQWTGIKADLDCIHNDKRNRLTSAHFKLDVFFNLQPQVPPPLLFNELDTTRTLPPTVFEWVKNRLSPYASPTKFLKPTESISRGARSKDCPSANRYSVLETSSLDPGSVPTASDYLGLCTTTDDVHPETDT